MCAVRSIWQAIRVIRAMVIMVIRAIRVIRVSMVISTARSNVRTFETRTAFPSVGSHIVPLESHSSVPTLVPTLVPL